MQKDAESFSFTVSPVEADMRLDHFLVQHLAGHSRSSLLRLVRDGRILVDGKTVKAGYRIKAQEKVRVTVPPPPPTELVPEQIDFTILHEDDSLLVLVKPPGLVVHPAAGHRSGTLAHGLLHHCESLPGVLEQRPGIVHRLDKETSGIMLVAKTDNALRKLTEDFHDRNIHKIYHALLLRSPPEKEGRIVEPIGRHPVKRKKMAIRSDGRYAATRWRVMEQFRNGMCLVELDLETGRTHQIRVHMASLGCPVAGDTLYGGRIPVSSPIQVTRQLLHASTISFLHPLTHEAMSFTAPLWPDILLVMDRLRKDSGST